MASSSSNAGGGGSSSNSNSKQGFDLLLNQLLQSPMSLSLVAGTILFSFLDFLSSGLFSLQPATLVFQPWTLITTNLVEEHLLPAMLKLTLLFFFARYFEYTWGSRELLKHFILISLLTNILTTFLLIFHYCLTFASLSSSSSNASDILFIRIEGVGAFICALLVALKRAIPEHKVKLFQTFSLRVKYLPSLNILLHFLFFLIGFLSLVSFYTHTIGSILSWVYIRFYKYHDGVMGDRSETFSFASFFPDAWFDTIKPISTAVYTILLRLRLLPPLPPRQKLRDPSKMEEGGSNDNNLNEDQQNLLGKDGSSSNADDNKSKKILEPFEPNAAYDSKRRKELAVKALNDRLALKKKKADE